jgi:uncharacterized membrane protein YphA (DoxX/SURF4 family)
MPAPLSTDQRMARVHAIARVALAIVFLWHGLIPKLLFHHPDEWLMLTDAGMGLQRARQVVFAAGIAEVLLGIWLLLGWRVRIVLPLIVVAMLLATAGIAVNSPRYLVAAFNPVTLNLCVLALAAIAWLSAPDSQPKGARP